MTSFTIHDLPDETYSALCCRAAANGRSIEAEVRDLLEHVLRPPDRVKLGSMLAEIGREVRGVDLLNARDQSAAPPIDLRD